MSTIEGDTGQGAKLDVSTLILASTPADSAIADGLFRHLLENGLVTSWNHWTIEEETSVHALLREAPPRATILFLGTNSFLDSFSISDSVAFALSREWRQKSILPIFLLERDKKRNNKFDKLLAQHQRYPLPHFHSLTDERALTEGPLHRRLLDLAKRLEGLFGLRYADLGGARLEKLSIDLLKKHGFDISIQPTVSDRGFDYVASIDVSDPFGMSRQERWAIEIKSGRQAGLSSLHQFVSSVEFNSSVDHGLYMSWSPLSSSAARWLDEVGFSRKLPVTILEESDLRRILFNHYRVARKFSAERIDGGSAG